MKWFKNEKVKYEMKEYKGYDLEYYSKKNLIDKLEYKDEVIKSLYERIQELDDNFDKSLKQERENLQQITKTHNERLIMINYISNMYEFTPLRQQSLLSYSEKRRYNMFK